MTYDGIKKLQDELDNRKTTVAAEIAERLKEARALGDLSENSEYDDAKEAQPKTKSASWRSRHPEKCRLIEMTRSAGPRSPSCPDHDPRRGDPEEMEYILVGAKEEDIFSNKISSDSPVGAAIIGKKKGQVVDVHTPAGILRYKIVKIDKPS
jgi:transcription elongation factor GreA